MGNQDNGRRHCGRASKGSRFHLQNLVNDHPDLLNCLLLSANPQLRDEAANHPRWVSPLASDDYCEYRDGKFLHAVGLAHLAKRLATFWPPGGPVWDALATVERKAGVGGVILLEAKSHVQEMGNPGYACKAGPVSRRHIAKSLDEVKAALGVRSKEDWLGDFYQYTNRLAHLYWLDSLGVPAWLVFLYFVGDVQQSGPAQVTQWVNPIASMRRQLGLPDHHSLDHRVVPVFAPV